MAAFIIRNGIVQTVNADIDELVSYATKAVKVASVKIFSYVNGVASLFVNYSDRAVGHFAGQSAYELRDWANAQRGWPDAELFTVQAVYPLMAEEETLQTPPPRMRITRTRKVAVEEVKSVKRVRRYR